MASPAVRARSPSGSGWRDGAASRLAFSLPVRLRLRETVPLLAVSAVGLLGWAFLALAGEVTAGDTTAFDRTILLALRDPRDPTQTLGPSWIAETARDLTGLGGHAILGLITISVLVYLAMTGRRGAAWLVAAAIGGGMLLSAGLKIGFDRPRPDLVPHAVRVYTASFPSGHAMLSAVTYLTLAALLARVNPERRVKLFLLGTGIALTLLIGLSRIYLGVHWPSDVLAGWCGGGAWASLCWYVALLLQRDGTVECGPTDPDAASSAS